MKSQQSSETEANRSTFRVARRSGAIRMVQKVRRKRPTARVVAAACCSIEYVVCSGT